MNESAQAFYAAREFLLRPTARTTTRPTATSGGRRSASSTGLWTTSTPSPPTAATSARCGSSSRTASEAHWTFRELSARSNQVANWLREQGVARGDRIILMLGNQVELWETLLAAMKLGAVVIPATTLLDGGRPARPAGPGQRQARRRSAARTRASSTASKAPTRGSRCVAPPRAGADYADADAAPRPRSPPTASRSGSDTLLLYFTSGTTAKPKLVEHTHASYPVGHLSTMYWIGLEPGDVHLNISSPGWAKHAWSNVFAPWIAEACVLVMNYARFDAESMLGVLDRCGVTSFCAPPTVWRMLIQADLSGLRTPPPQGRGGGGAAEPRGDRAGREGVGGADPRRVRPDRVHRADRQLAGPDGEARLDGTADPGLPDRAGRPGDGGA